MNINVTGWLPVNDVKSIQPQQLDLFKKNNRWDYFQQIVNRLYY